MRTVTLITPIYNTKDYIPRLLDSVLSQTCESIEMIIVDDGSTDGSSDVVRGYIPKFQERGYALTLLRQENQGQAAAICNALPYVTGKYLAWPDSDDYYASKDAIERMVSTLRSAGEGFAVVRTQKRKVKDVSGETLEIQGLDVKPKESAGLFRDCLEDKNGWYFCAGGYMVDFEVFKKVTHLKMFHKKGVGQNWQMLLPVLYSHRCASIPEALYTVVSREESHCRRRYSLLERIHRKHLYLRLLLSTLWSIREMPVREKLRYSLYVVSRYGLLCSLIRLIIKKLLG